MNDHNAPSSSSRVPSSEAARLIDEMIEAVADCPPARLYRLLSQELGLHPVTFLRYHRGRLASLAATRMEALEKVHRRVLAGELKVPEPPQRGHRPPVANGRVAASTLRPLFDRLLDQLQLTERQVLYRCLAERTGLHETTLLRYHNGSLASAPAALEQDLRVMLEECRRESLPELTRAEGGDAVVPRAVYRARIDQLARAGAYECKADLFRDLSRPLEEPSERLRKAYYDSRIRLVPRSFCEQAEELTEKLTYDPARIFKVGERVRHPHFGAGVVREKRPHRAILVELSSGQEVLLREGYRHDPYRARCEDSDWLSTSSSGSRRASA